MKSVGDCGSYEFDDVLTAPQSPWHNAYTERMIGSIRRECLNHFIILNARHLKRNVGRLLSLLSPIAPSPWHSKNKCPIERQIMKDGAIV
jgi:hypothetical protein